VGQRIELGDLTDLRDGQLRAFPDVGSNGIVVCRVAGQLHALADNCSHRDTPLSEGRLRGTTITCPLHGAQFDVRTGAHLCPPAFEGVAVYPIDEDDGSVTVEL
jgi:3-phenylpropionate/trans-cinnamate dioxygenase ferredoxin subunit